MTPANDNGPPPADIGTDTQEAVESGIDAPPPGPAGAESSAATADAITIPTPANDNEPFNPDEGDFETVPHESDAEGGSSGDQGAVDAIDSGPPEGNSELHQGPDDEAGKAERELPALRQAYENDVRALGGLETKMREAGATNEEIARALHAERRAIGEKYKNLTEEPWNSFVYARNEVIYDDEFGPSVDTLRERGKSWEQIIESAKRPGSHPFTRGMPWSEIVDEG